jgi:hypothetical protein
VRVWIGKICWGWIEKVAGWWWWLVKKLVEEAKVEFIFLQVGRTVSDTVSE